MSYLKTQDEAYHLVAQETERARLALQRAYDAVVKANEELPSGYRLACTEHVLRRLRHNVGELEQGTKNMLVAVGELPRKKETAA